ncbi:hypothetical protein GIY62_14635 [Burkholderia plantarii]|uniref:hypothetical protein n=1 Tax=Burkholderia plantarii TaxID=41899 RepID=UPI00272AE78C|nr:hypothetical protein [Burkholderia plantarii]WLE58363.1 hypothetical protein GIY62_14635 [Burkholderia plantarii]
MNSSLALLPSSARLLHTADSTHVYGHVLRRAFDCSYPPAIIESDLIHVDFDVREVRANGLYLVEAVKPGASRLVEWRGCRRFDLRPGGLHMDVSGSGEWIPAALDAWHMRIAGMVIDVYRSSRAKGATHG